MALAATAIYISVLAVWMFYLGLRVANLRRGHQIGLGERDNRELAVAIRVHANTVENVPITLLLMLVLALQGIGPWLIHACGGLLVLARLSHAWGMTQSGGRYSIFRVAGITLNWLLMLILAVANLLLPFIK
jgi:uncharacterized protein